MVTSCSNTIQSTRWFKLNTDVSSLGNPEGGGGLIHDFDGNRIRGQSRAIGFAMNVMAKLWASRMV